MKARGKIMTAVCLAVSGVLFLLVVGRSGGATADLALAGKSNAGEYVVVDDFDSYQNLTELFSVWNDSVGNNSGAQIFLDKDPNFVRDGNSVILLYQNSYMSEGRYVGSWMDANPAELEIGADWTVSGANRLVVYFRGDALNSAAINNRMWVELEDTSSNVGLVLYDGDANDLTEEWWHEWNIDLWSFDALGVQLTEVGSVAIGFGGYERTGQTADGGTGYVWFDDIRLCGDGGVIPGLIAHWTFDEGTGTTVYDSAGDNDGNLIGDANWTTGQIGGALEFDGVDDYVDVPYDHSLNVTANGDPDFAVEAWINVALFPSGTVGDIARYILYRGVQPSKYQFALDIYKDTNYFNIISFAIGAPGGGGTGTISPTLQVNRWYHVVGTYDGYNIFLYLNGEEVYWNYRNYTSQGVWEGSAPLYIGTKVNEEFFNGIIDEVAIYNRALSAEEIWQLYQDGLVQLVGLEITGLKEVAENFEAKYTAIAYYDNNSTEDVTDLALWLVGPEEIASIESGLLRIEEIDEPQDITIYAQYTEGDITVGAEKEVSVFAVCPRGSALQFDGEDDYADCGSTFADVVGSATKTIMGWAKSDTTSYPSQTLAGAGRILTLYRESGSSGFTIYAQGEPATWRGLYRKAANVSQDIDSGVSVIANEWTHVALVQDGADVDIYINGVSENSSSDAAAPTTWRHVNADIGAYDAETAMKCFFDGLIDEVAIYDGALSGEEIQANMHLPADDGEPNLVAYWDFDEGQGQVIYDISGNVNNGYLGSDPCNVNESDPNWVDSDAPMGICTQPIAHAGPDQNVSAGAGCVAEVALDGSDSNDADGDELTYAWLMDGEEIATGVNPVIELPMGEHAVELVVNDGFEDSEPDEVVITVEDATPPEFSLAVEPNVLWPPNGKMVLVRPEWEVSDNCDEEVEVSLVDISMNAAGDINDYVEMGDDGSIYLRARKGGSGRIYTLTYEAVDDSGNVAEASATVTVPHNRGLRKLSSGLVLRPGRQVYRRGVQREGAKK